MTSKGARVSIMKIESLNMFSDVHGCLFEITFYVHRDGTPNKHDLLYQKDMPSQYFLNRISNPRLLTPQAFFPMLRK